MMNWPTLHNLTLLLSLYSIILLMRNLTHLCWAGSSYTPFHYSQANSFYHKLQFEMLHYLDYEFSFSLSSKNGNCVSSLA